METLTVEDTVILKCETQKSFKDIPSKGHVWDLLMSVASTYSYKEDMYRFWTYTKKDELLNYLRCKNVVGYNCVSFDLPLVIGSQYDCDPTYIINLRDKTKEVEDPNRNKYFCVCSDIYMKELELIYKVNTYDKVRDKIFRNPITNKAAYSLYNVYVSTIGRAIPVKVLSINPNELFNARNILGLMEFNMFKLRLVKQLYEYILRHHYIINGEFDVLRMDNIKSPKAVSFDDFLPF